MRIVKVEHFEADAGWRTFCFVKITTDEGLVGWSEYKENYWSPGLGQVIRKMAESVIGEDPRDVARLGAKLYAMTRMTAGGQSHQALSAIENACLDIKARALGVPVYALLGGAVRKRIPVYWSHCGTFQAQFPEIFEKLLGERTQLVSVTHMSNALGTINPVGRIVDLVHSRGVPVLLDGAQAIPHMAVDMQELYCDFRDGDG